MPTPSLARRIFLWFVFVALVAALPPLANWFISFLDDRATSVMALLAEGDGFLIAVAITADAIGRGLQQPNVPVFPTVACGVVLLFALLAFGVTRTGLMTHKTAVDAARTEAIKSIESLDVSTQSGKPLSIESLLLQAADDAQCANNMKKMIAVVLKLSDALDKKAEGETSERRVVLMSEIIVCCGVIASFIVVLRG